MSFGLQRVYTLNPVQLSSGLLTFKFFMEQLKLKASQLLASKPSASDPNALAQWWASWNALADMTPSSGGDPRGDDKGRQSGDMSGTGHWKGWWNASGPPPPPEGTTSESPPKVSRKCYCS